MQEHQLPSGANDHRNWKSLPGNDHQNPLARMVSLHEAEHTIINETTAYGMCLSFYSQLAENALSEKEKFAEVFRLLEPNVKFTHECGATYSGVLNLMLRDESITPEFVLGHYPQYIPYYDFCEQMVGTMPGIFLKRLVILMAVGVAMQSRNFGEAIIKNPLGFSLSDIRAIDLPDNRL